MFRLGMFRDENLICCIRGLLQFLSNLSYDVPSLTCTCIYLFTANTSIHKQSLGEFNNCHLHFLKRLNHLQGNVTYNNVLFRDSSVQQPSKNIGPVIQKIPRLLSQADNLISGDECKQSEYLCK